MPSRESCGNKGKPSKPEFNAFGRGFVMASLIIINSLLAHIDDLKIFMSSSKFDVLAINETEPDSYISDSEINLTVFDVARRGPYREQEM